MSRLDHHVTKVQGKMLLSGMLLALSWSLLVYGALVWLVILVSRLIGLDLPKQWLLLGIGTAVACLCAVIYSIVRKPTRETAAVEIDQRLGLKEKFSTALFLRKQSSDPFASAALRDAEMTAERVHLQDKFPVEFTRTWAFTFGVIVVAFLTGWLLQPMDLLGRKARAAAAAEQQQKDSEVKREIKAALAKIESAPPAVQKDEKIQIAAKELRDLMAKPVKDPTAASRTAQNALEDVKAQAQKIKEIQAAAQAMNEMQAWKEMSNRPIDESGPVGKAQSELAKGNFTKAIDSLKNTVDNFDNMKKEDKDKAAKQMQDLAQQLKAMANDPKVQQQIQKELEKQGATQQQAQQIAKQMQQAANGDKQAQQQLQQAANQMMQQMNNGQGPTAQQQTQMQGLLQKLQTQAQGQAQAQQLANNAQNLAKAMQQAANPQQQAKQGPNGQQQQAGAGQQAQQQGQQPGQQPGGQQQGGQQQQGNQGQQQAAQAAAQQAKQQMQQQVAEMQAMADAAQQGGGQQPGGDGQQPGQGEQPGGQGQQQQANNQQPGNNKGQGGPFKKGDPNGKQGNGFGGPGQANGGGPKPTETPFDTVKELSRSKTDDKGKIVASNFVKAGALKGESKAKLQEIIKSNENEATDEVDSTRVSRQARDAVLEYNRSIAPEVTSSSTEKSATK
jgi:hypothetical protein